RCSEETQQFPVVCTMKPSKDAVVCALLPQYSTHCFLFHKNIRADRLFTMRITQDTVHCSKLCVSFGRHLRGKRDAEEKNTQLMIDKTSWEIAVDSGGSNTKFRLSLHATARYTVFRDEKHTTGSPGNRVLSETSQNSTPSTSQKKHRTTVFERPRCFGDI
ncbi:MAG: uncharacterized protein A8A55_2995, partial [Amphiamblys sp. WSBS2006]